MSARTTFDIDATPASPPAGATETGRTIFVGLTQTGDTGVPTLVQGFAAFEQEFGQRVTATAALHDAVRLFFAEGGAECWILRAGGPTDTITDHAAVLANAPASLGATAIAWPGLPSATVGAALSAHALATGRLALLSAAPDADKTAILTAATAAAAFPGASAAALVWPAVKRLDDQVVDPVAFAAACRSRAHAVMPGVPAWGARYGRTRTGLVAATLVADADFAAIDAARIGVIHDVYGVLTLDGFHLAAPIGGNDYLDEASHRDALTAIAHEMQRATTQWTGGFSSRTELTAWAGALTGIAARYAAAGVLTPPDPSKVPAGVIADPGYVIDVGPSVNTANDLASGSVAAKVSVRLTGTLEFAALHISASDAASAAF